MAQFWEHKALEEMSRKEWESLCDGCGRCCLNKLEDTDTFEIFYTNIACKLLDAQRCQCKNYKKRHDFVPDCLVLTPANVFENTALPSSCAYRRLAEGKTLAAWHPLVSGDANSVHAAGISVTGRTYSEEFIPEDDFEAYIVHWFDDEDER
jgi:uncharacterized protein